MPYSVTSIKVRQNQTPIPDEQLVEIGETIHTRSRDIHRITTKERPPA